jgi:phosphatidylethanolamine-binding protein (PEBP) family uncharacterized protein
MEKGTTYWITVILLATFCVVGLYFDISNSTSNDAMQSVSLRFSWSGIPACKSISPAFELGSVPDDTTHLHFNMTDLNVPTFHHGSSTIAYAGDAVSRGSIAYTGPCPPRGERHKYRWTVQALDDTGKVLAKGSAEALFPPDRRAASGYVCFAPKADIGRATALGRKPSIGVARFAVHNPTCERRVTKPGELDVTGQRCAFLSLNLRPPFGPPSCYNSRRL